MIAKTAPARDSTAPARDSIVPPEQWNDWHWHVRNRITTLDQLRGWVDVTEEEVEAIERCPGRYQWGITPYYASVMDPADTACPVRRQAVPQLDEFENPDGTSLDPIADTSHQKTNRVIHKYPDRVGFLVTAVCPTYCRHCFRKHHTMEAGGTYFRDKESTSMDEDFAYIAAHPEVRDIVLTGGEPLSYRDHKIEEILARLREIDHVEVIRIGSRMPVLLPQRITRQFTEMLDRYQPVWLQTHFNHAREITPAAADACDRLLRAGVPVMNQTALLRGVNDDVETMRELCTGLVRIRVKPYYLYHCDNSTGVAHFSTSLERGLEIMEGLIGHISGFAIPQYIFETPIAKHPVIPSYVEIHDGVYEARNWKGETYTARWLERDTARAAAETQTARVAARS